MDTSFDMMNLTQEVFDLILRKVRKNIQNLVTAMTDCKEF